MTSSKPFPDDWLHKLCTKAETSADVSDGMDEPIRLERIPGQFQGWTPFRLARDYVMPHLTRKADKPFAWVSFVILDDQSHLDDKVLIVGVHPDSFKGSQLEIEGTIRLGAENAVDLPIIFHDGIQGILSYGADPYDNEAERNADR